MTCVHTVGCREEKNPDLGNPEWLVVMDSKRVCSLLQGEAVYLASKAVHCICMPGKIV